jgi:hypothetical protein
VLKLKLQLSSPVAFCQAFEFEGRLRLAICHSTVASGTTLNVLVDTSELA